MSSSYIVLDSLESARFLFIPSWSSRICLSRSRWYVWEKLWWNISNDSEMSCFMILHLQVPEISDIVEKVDGLTSLSVSLWIAQLASQRVSYSVSLSASQSFIICQVNIPVIQFVTRYNVRCVSYIIIIHEFFSLSVSPSVGTIVPTPLSHQSFPCRLVYRTPKILLTYFEKRHTFTFSFTAWPITKGLVKQTTCNSE